MNVQALNDILPVRREFTIPADGKIFFFPDLVDTTLLVVERGGQVVSDWVHVTEEGDPDRWKIRFQETIFQEEKLYITYRKNPTAPVPLGTLADYVNERLTRIGFSLSSDELTNLFAASGIDSSVGISPETELDAKRVIAFIIPELLAMPRISEGGYSIAQNMGGVLTYYRLLCAELGIENKLEPKPKVRYRSLW